MTPDSSPFGVDGPGPGSPDDLSFALSPTLVAMESPATSRAAVALHEMAGQLITQQVDCGRRGVAVCAPNRYAGASMVAANLAIAIARAGVSVLLVDCNLHDAGLDALISPSQSILGLQQILREPDVGFDDAIQPELLPGLSILLSGGACRDASELVGDRRCGELLRAAMRNYDYTILDVPPANRSPDASRLASYIGYGLIVARRNRTYVDDVTTLAGELADARVEVIGTIYNAG